MSARRSGQLAAVAALTLLATVAAVGWMYVLRPAGALAAGPRVTGALPLQRLAGQSAQPLLRFLLAWVPGALLAGVAISRFAGALPRARRAVAAGAVSFVVLAIAGALSDAVTANEGVGPHLAAQAGRGATWLAALIMLASVFALGAGEP